MATALSAIPEHFAPDSKLIERSEEFRTKFDKYSFAFRHRLAGHPVFQLSRIMELAQETQTARPADLYYDAGTSNESPGSDFVHYFAEADHDLSYRPRMQLAAPDSGG